MSRTSPAAGPVRIALLGGDGAAIRLMDELRELDPEGEHLRVVGFCCFDPGSPALEAARAAGVPHVGREVSRALPDGGVDVAVDLREVSEPGVGISDLIPRGTTLLDAAGARLFFGLTRAAGALRELSRREHSLLEDARERLDRFMEYAPFAVYRKDADLVYRAVNQAGLALLEREPEEILGRTDEDLFQSAIARRIRSREQKVLKTRRSLSFDGVLPRRDGGSLYISATLFPVELDGEAIGLYGLIQDVTDLHDSEKELVQEREKLAERRQFLGGILENSQDLILLLQPDGTILEMNQGAEQITGLDRGAVIGRPLAELAASGPEMEALLAAALADGHAAAYEMQLRHRSGRPVITNVTLTTITSRGDRPLEVVCIARNITDRLKLQDDLIQSERLAAIGKMAAGVAHEINNPLTIIENMAGYMQETLAEESDSCPPDVHDVVAQGLENIFKQTRRCTTITHNLLGFARKSSGRLVETSVTDVLEQALVLLLPETRRLGLRVERHYTRGLPKPITDPMLLEQIFVNLLKNAADAIEEAAPRQPLIRLFASPVENPAEEGMSVAVTVQDNGVGIPDENLSQVFDLFYTSKPAGKGTGLGLSIVHNILKKLGGEIRVESEPGEGSSFTVILPLHYDYEDEDGELIH